MRTNDTIGCAQHVKQRREIAVQRRLLPPGLPPAPLRQTFCMTIDGETVLTGGGKGGEEYGCVNVLEAHKYTASAGTFLTVPAGGRPFQDPHRRRKAVTCSRR